MRIAIIGAGWNGCHLAIELTKAGHDITVLEKLPAILSGCSGTFGIRLHRGPHYPRSKSTREGCHAAFERFCETYPEIIKHHQDSIYAHGERDAEGCPPKVSADTFKDVCFETKECQKVDVEAKAVQGVTAAYDVDEPSVAIGTELRRFFEHKLAAEGVEVVLDVEVQKIRRRPGEPLTVVYRKNSPGNRCLRRTGFLDADFIVNATGYQSLTPNQTTSVDAEAQPLGCDVVYQACIAFRYEDTAPGEKPFSFIVMDGWFPCLMPSIDGDPAAYATSPQPSPPRRHYILTHGSYTILGSFTRPEQAQDLLDRVCSPSPSFSPSSSSRDSAFTNEANLVSQLRTAAETEICRFWPPFRDRFHYRGCQGSVLAKLRTECEFRSSVVFARDSIIYVFPGKISNVFRASDDVLSLIATEAARRVDVKGRGKGGGNKSERRGGKSSGDCRREKEEGEVIMVDGYWFVKSTLADVNEARSHQGGGGRGAISGGDEDLETKDDVRSVEESRGKSTCDLQTFKVFQEREMRGSAAA